MVRRTKEAALETRDSILNAAEKLFSQQGVVVSTLEQVAIMAGVTRGAVYWHYESKKDLCAAVAARNAILLKRIELELEENKNSAFPLTSLEATYQKLLAFFLRKKQYLLLSFLPASGEQIPDLHELAQEHYRNIRDVFSWNKPYMLRARRLKSLSLNWAPEHAALSLESYLMGLCLSTYTQKRSVPAIVASANLCAFFKTLQNVNKK